MQTHTETERAASALAATMLLDDKTAAAKFGVSVRSVQRWRALLDTDDELAALVAQKKEALERDWAEDLGDAITKSIGFLGRAAADADTKDPAVIHSVAGALKILTDVATARQVLDARLRRQAGQTAETARQIPASRTGTA